MGTSEYMLQGLGIQGLRVYLWGLGLGMVFDAVVNCGVMWLWLHLAKSAVSPW